MKKFLLSLFAVTVLGLPALAEQVTFNFSEIYSNVPSGGNQSVDGTTVTIDPISISYAKNSGGTAPAYYANGAALRIYAGNTFTISAKNNNITEISLTFGTNDNSKGNAITTTVGTYESSTWTGSASSVTFTEGGSSGNRQIASIVVTYGDGTTTPEPGPGTDPTPEAGNPYSIVFGTSTTDASSNVTSTTLKEYITSGASYITGAENITNVYKGVKGLKFGSSKANGSVTLNLSEQGQVNVAKIVVNAASYNSTNLPVLEVNGEKVNMTSANLEDYTFNFKGEQINAITIATSSNNYRAYVQSIQVYPVAQEGDNQRLPANLVYGNGQEVIDVTGIPANFNAPELKKDTNAPITYETSDEKVATVDTDGKVTIVNYGSATITASAEANDQYFAGSTSFTINVSPGLINVATALELLSQGLEFDASVTGIISSITEISTSFGNATYEIKDALTDTKSLTVYRGKALNGNKFTSEDEIEVGGTVTVKGSLLIFTDGTYEFTTGSEITSYTAPSNGGDNTEDDGTGGEDNDGGSTGGEDNGGGSTGGEDNGGGSTGGEDNGGGSTGGEPTEPEVMTAVFNFTQPSTLNASMDGEVISLDIPETPQNASEIDVVDVTFTEGVISVTGIGAEESGSSTSLRLYYNASGWTYRFYDGETITIAAEEGYSIASIEFNATYLNTTQISWTGEGDFENNVWTSDEDVIVSEVVISKNGTGNNPTISTITVNYVTAETVGINGMETELNAPVEFYNLQGLKVNNPVKGQLYIIRQGKNAKKVIF